MVQHISAEELLLHAYCSDFCHHPRAPGPQPPGSGLAYLSSLPGGEDKQGMHGVLSSSCAGPSQGGGTLARVFFIPWEDWVYSFKLTINFKQGIVSIIRSTLLNVEPEILKK